MSIELLDCTLRDGGYVNNWMFDTETAKMIIEGLYKAGVRYIEIGIMGQNPEIGKQTKFSNFEQIKPLLTNRKVDCHYAIMVTTASSSNFTFPICNEETPDVIRIAFFKSEIPETFELARKLKTLGYKVFMQAMATHMYSDDELVDLVNRINELNPISFYMVDSFSTLFPADVRKMRDNILSVLDERIIFGFHAHNNLQMAYANVQEFVQGHNKRTLMIDGSIYGMGRGAGNVPTELIMLYINKYFDGTYDTSVVLELFEKNLKSIYTQYGWGYTLPYYLTAQNTLNSVWGWFFMNQGIDSLSDLSKALQKVPLEWKYTLKPELGVQIVKEIRGL